MSAPGLRELTDARRHLVERAQRVERDWQGTEADRVLATDLLRDSMEELAIAEESLRAQVDELSASTAEIARQRSRYVALFELAPDGYMTTDSNGSITGANGAVSRILNVQREELIRKPVFVFVPIDRRRELRRLLGEFENGRGSARIVVPLAPRRRPGIEFEILIVRRAVDESKGPELLWQLRDLTDRRRAEAAEIRARELRAANAAKDEFIGLVSHELRTPLTVIIGNASQLARNGIATDEAAAMLAEIQSESERLHVMIDNMLRLAWAEHDSSLPLSEPILLDHHINAAVNHFRSRKPGRVFSVSTDSVGPVLADPGFVEQVLHNLLSNADKYSPPEAPVGITLVERGEVAIVSVSDEGPGLEPAELDRIFDPFFRSPSVRGRVPGVGLGLVVCRKLIERMNGTLHVAPNPGGGTVFSFDLRLVGPLDADI